MSERDFSTYRATDYAGVRFELVDSIYHFLKSKKISHVDLFLQTKKYRKKYNCEITDQDKKSESKIVTSDLQATKNKQVGKYVPLYLHWLWDNHREYAEDFLKKAEEEKKRYLAEKKKQSSSTSKTGRKPKKTVPSKSERYVTTTSEDNWLSPRNDTFIPFVGRNEEIVALDAFVKYDADKPGDFKLWAVVGPSGAGKTRLLVHWANRDILDGWDVIDVNSRTSIDWPTWSPECPTLISIDYIYGYDKTIADIIAAGEKGGFKYPVRLLMLDHATPDSMKELLKDPRWGFDGGRPEDMVKMENSIFWKNAPMKLSVPEDEEAEDKSKAYDEFLAKIICAVVYKEEKDPFKKINDPAIKQGLEYLKETKGARQPLFAALVGDAIKNSGDDGEAYKKLNRRALIENYLQGKTRLTWQLEGSERGTWAACFIAAATARRNVTFNTLRNAVPKEQVSLISRDYKKFKSLCNSVVSGSDRDTLKAFEPDILGETHFLLFLKEIEDNFPDFENYLPALITAGKGDIADQAANEFIAFLTRLARNLSNDDQADEETIKYWGLLTEFLTQGRFDEDSPFRRAVAMSCFEISEVLKEKEQIDTADQFLKKVDADNIYAPPEHQMSAWHVWQAVKYFSIDESKNSVPPEQLKALLKVWDAGKNRDYTALMLAIWAGSSTVAHYLIDQKVDLKAVGKDGWTALMLACSAGHDAVVQRLIDAKVNLEAQARDKGTALMFACGAGHDAVVQRLIDAKVNLEAQDKIKITALMLACGAGHNAVVQRLIDAKVNLEAQDRDKWTALMVACHYGHEAVVQRLIDAKTNLEAQDRDKWTALMVACHYGHDAVVQRLIDAKVNLEAQDKIKITALMLACSAGHDAVVQRLIDAKANLEAQDRDKWTALMVACGNGHDAVVQRLIDAKVNLEAQSKDKGTALMVACGYGHDAVVQRLIGAKVNLEAQSKDKWTALMVACRYGHDAVVQRLIGAKVNLEAQDRDKWTALMVACGNGHDAVVQRLIDAKVNLEAQSKDKGTALMVACGYGHEAVVQRLIGAKVNLEAQSKDKWTALMVACRYGHEAVVQRLIGAKVNLEAQDRDKWTALMVACHYGHEAVVRELIKRKVPTDDIWEHGEIKATALGLARNAGHHEIIEMLEAAGALELPPYNPS